MAAKLKAPLKELGAEAPLLNCPFTGLPLKIVQTPDKMCWYARSSSEEGGFMTTAFGDKEELMYFLSFRNGVRPQFPKRTRIEVRESIDPTYATSGIGMTGAGGEKSYENDIGHAIDRLMAGKSLG